MVGIHTYIYKGSGEIIAKLDETGDYGTAASGVLLFR